MGVVDGSLLQILQDFVSCLNEFVLFLVKWIVICQVLNRGMI